MTQHFAGGGLQNIAGDHREPHRPLAGLSCCWPPSKTRPTRRSPA
jgi:hypothetical protein